MEQFILKTFFLKKKIIFPYCTLNVFIRTSDETKEIKKGDRILAVTIRTALDLVWRRNRLATLSEVLDVQPGDAGVKILLKGLTRVKMTKIIRYKYAEFELLKPQSIDPHDTINELLRKKAQELIFLINVEESDKLINLLNYIIDVNQMTDFISNYFVMDFPARYRLYTEVDATKRSRMLTTELPNLINWLTKKRKNTAL